jgi:nicotinate-nucleotide adenylyltransferase
MRIGLFFGSFNPIHIGHLIIANYMATTQDLQKVWLVVSPHNPHKPKKTLARDADRLHLVRLALEDNPKLEASNVEFALPKPSYTIDTLIHLKDKYSQHSFALIMGGDNLATLHSWKNYERILENHDVYVYKRPDTPLGALASHPRIKICADTPLLDISATYIRTCIREGRSVRYLVPEPVFQYLETSTLYQKEFES